MLALRRRQGGGTRSIQNVIAPIGILGISKRRWNENIYSESCMDAGGGRLFSRRAVFKAVEEERKEAAHDEANCGRRE